MQIDQPFLHHIQGTCAIWHKRWGPVSLFCFSYMLFAVIDSVESRNSHRTSRPLWRHRWLQRMSKVSASARLEYLSNFAKNHLELLDSESWIAGKRTALLRQPCSVLGNRSQRDSGWVCCKLLILWRDHSCRVPGSFFGSRLLRIGWRRRG